MTTYKVAEVSWNRHTKEAMVIMKGDDQFPIEELHNRGWEILHTTSNSGGADSFFIVIRRLPPSLQG